MSEKTYEVELKYIVEAENEAEAIVKFRKVAQQVEASIFDVKTDKDA